MSDIRYKNVVEKFVGHGFATQDKQLARWIQNINKNILLAPYVTHMDQMKVERELQRETEAERKSESSTKDSLLHTTEVAVSILQLPYWQDTVLIKLLSAIQIHHTKNKIPWLLYILKHIMIWYMLLYM